MHDILQSTKVYRVTDGVNEAYITGSVGSYRAKIGREYNKIKFNHAHATKEDARTEAALYARAVISGRMDLRGESGKSPEEMVDIVVRRFLRNVDHAKTVEVESITTTEQGFHIIFGDKGFNRLNELEPRLMVDDSKLSGNEPIPFFTTKIAPSANEKHLHSWRASVALTKPLNCQRPSLIWHLWSKKHHGPSLTTIRLSPSLAI